jgi:hypothetical protein
LTERELLNWRSFDSFVNACLLGRPHRRYDAQQRRLDFVARPFEPARDRFDPELMTATRYFTRDTGTPRNALEAPVAPPQPESPPQPVDPSAVPDPAQAALYSGFDEQDRLEQAKTAGGVAAWNDFSAASAAARETLREAAGISVPSRRFVLTMVGIYLLVVVPLNWLVFRLAGRVEWAWIAVPVLAIGWGVVVVWFAQLDIGFARAETEVAVLEVQGGFDRGHLTRYMALYSSLSTTYDVHFADPSALAQPFALDRSVPLGEGRSTVTLRSLGDQQLNDFPVSSNSTGMVHSEQMIPLGGALAWSEPADEQPTVENKTRLKLSGVAIVRRRGAESAAAAGGQREPNHPQLFADEAAWIGTLAPGAKATVEFKPYKEAAPGIAAARGQSGVTAKRRPEGVLSLRRLVAIAEDAGLLAPGDVRLVGWYDQGLPGVEANPSAAQARRATLVVANLRFGTPEARPDENLAPEEKPADE